MRVGQVQAVRAHVQAPHPCNGVAWRWHEIAATQPGTVGGWSEGSLGDGVPLLDKLAPVQVQYGALHLAEMFVDLRSAPGRPSSHTR